MIVRWISGLAVLAAVVVLGVIIFGSGGSSYVIRMSLADADGLRQGSPVAIGGQDIGTIQMRVVDDRVLVDMSLDRSQAPVGRDATASIASVNLLGQKRIELTKGDIREPAPSGYVLPASQVSVTTDLDQVLDVLSPDVRTRLGILINEAGLAFTGRRADFSDVLEQLPPDLNAGTELLNGISADNHTLADLVQSSSGFVTELATQRAQLIHMIDVFGNASTTVAARRQQLAATLAKAPQTLETLQGFLVDLKQTTVPLGPAAEDITDTAPALNTTLAQLEPFRRAADPTLQEATKVAPELTDLAVGATPVVQRATPVVSSLATFASALAPISEIVNRSADNLVAILQNWARAIQFRDGLSHVFRGEATFTPQTLVSMINQLQQAGLLGSTPSARRASDADRRAAAGQRVASHATGTTPSAPTATREPAGSGSRTSGSSSGAGTTTTTTTTTTSTSTSTTPSAPANPLQSLLSYLIKP